MDGELLRIILITGLAVTGGLWLALSLLIRVGGTWVRELSDEELARGERPETIELSGLGPYISGRAEVDGGHQEFTGLLIGRTLHLRRRDHGLDSLLAAGYPEPIAKKRDGEEAARLKLKLDGDRLSGGFTAQKVEFTHQPPRITSVLPMPAQPRTYSRAVAVGAGDRSRIGDAIASANEREPAAVES